MVLHYGQAIFEGLKAYRQPDGSLKSFRPEANAERFRSSARRLAMPELPEDVFLGSLRELLAVDGAGCRSGRRGVPVPAAVHDLHGEGPRRPAGEGVRVRAHRLARRLLLQRRPAAGERVAVHRVRAGRPRRHRRGQVRRQLRRVAAGPGPGGRRGLRPGRVARRHGAALGRGDGRHEPVLRVRLRGRREVVTPELSGSLLPGITRDSILRVAADLGHPVEERGCPPRSGRRRWAPAS